MWSPSDSSTNRIARLVMRTHAVPTPASANGSTASARATSTMPMRDAAGCERQAARKAGGAGASGTVAHPLAEQARGPEDQHGDQHEEREHVLVVAAEERHVRVVDAPLGD